MKKALKAPFTDFVVHFIPNDLVIPDAPPHHEGRFYLSVMDAERQPEMFTAAELSNLGMERRLFIINAIKRALKEAR